jgi:hypothetical protein
MPSFRSLFVHVLLLSAACATQSPPPAAVASTPAPAPHLPEEVRLRDLKQLTFDGENAEAYWSFDGQQVSLQRRAAGVACDRIYTMKVFDDGKLIDHPEPHMISSGLGATTCSYFFPGAKQLLYASTHLASDECPPKPDMSQGYVWAIYEGYDIFKANADGTALTRLTATPGYDAEGTVCGKDGSIVFTSVRDGDIELYRMDADGKNVVRLTHEPGYDGGAFFNADCSKIVWRASRPKPGPELEGYQALLKQGLVRPTKLELYVANADGSDARQVTYLNAASFAPFWYPGRERIIFSSNYGDPKGREFDLWAINANGTELERLTYTPGFDGFPMFTPDGKWLMFSSNRATAPGASDTNLFLARFDAAVPPAKPLQPTAAERTLADATWLADPAREGRGIGTAGLAAAGAYLEQRMRGMGLEPLGDDGTFRAKFQVTTAVHTGSGTELTVAGQSAPPDQFVGLGWSGQGEAKGQLVLAGYAIQDADLGIDDFKGLDVKGKIVVARRFAPENEKLVTAAEQRRAGDLRRKAFHARAHGAKGLIVVDWPLTAAKPAAQSQTLPDQATLPPLEPQGPGDAGIPVVVARRSALAAVWAKLEAKQRVEGSVGVKLDFEHADAFNVVGRIKAEHSTKERGPIILGAHYDHLGYGGRDSLAPDQHVPHLGADDNASGTATILEIARVLQERRSELQRDVVVAAFSGEEMGVLGSAALVASKPAWLEHAQAMINLDMVGRMRDNNVDVLGIQTATEWTGLVNTACDAAHVHCSVSGDGYGPSDQISFYSAGLPVLHFFTGPHADYHKPSDTPDKLNAAGMAQIADIVERLILATQGVTLSYQKTTAPEGRGDARSWNASLGTVPDYAGPPHGIAGVLLSDVRPGGGADRAGMKRGDILVKLGTFTIRGVEDLMFVLMQAKPGETVTAVVLRDGKEVSLPTTFQEGRRH